MRTPQDPRQRVEPLRKRDQMDVVPHQAIPQNVQPVEARELLKQTHLDEAIAVRLENRPPGVPPLGDVMRRIHRQHPSQNVPSPGLQVDDPALNRRRRGLRPVLYP
jgi:hypothetical protein